MPILCAFLPYSLLATHNRAGEIHIQQIGPLTVRATIITWTRTSSVNADRDTLTINWGDGTSESVPRDNGNGIPYPNDIKYNIYVKDHTFAGPATYRISMTDPNRIAGIINVNPPSSDNVPFHIETIYSFQDPQFGGNNTTPYLLQPPIDNACVGKLFIHNPNAFDPEGDSLSYQLIVPLQGLSTPVPNYSYPDEIISGSNNTLQLDERTGIISWFSPQAAGEYNLAFIVVSWRGGVPIDTTIRDMQIFVDRCENNPPNVQTVDELCVIAGTTVEFPVFATDPDSNDYVQLTALGGPLDANLISRATFTGPTGFQRPPLTGTFRWQTTCEHISNQPYSVVFKAVDSQDSVTAELADLKTVSIKVVGPPPEDVQATTDQGSVEVTWGKPYVCENAADNYFYGFSVWRREGSKSFPLDTCAPGLAGKGYTQLIFVTKQTQNGRYYFKDTNVERGRTYCYRILGKFARISAGGYPYNVVESLRSEEVCVQLPRDLPLLTNVSVVETDATAGQIKVVWTKPSARELDTIVNHGPYRYQLLRAPGFS
ncbi:MAG: gliding motility-associated C-terminal domain-containing protein, partial [Saprospiraceae bacterium]|nr:gliding motility-associated C-terminal domain-containing protein [Saprospiraceae bacterium]